MADDTLPLQSDGDDGGAPVEGFACPECGKVVSTRLALGGHRYGKHGVRGTSETQRKRREQKEGTRARGSTSRGTSQAQVIREVRASLADSARKLGALAYPVAPIPALYLRETGDDMADVVSRMASRNPRMLRWLQGSSDAMDYLALGTWVAGLAVAVGVQVGRVPIAFDTPDGKMANPVVSVFGIDRLYAEAAADFGGDDGAAGNGQAVGERSPAATVVEGRPD